MDTVFGIVGDGFVIVVADRTALRQPLNFKHDEQKVIKVDDFKALAAAGENCDRVAFTEYVVRNMTLDRYRSKLDRSVKATAHMIRGELAKALRKSPFNVNLLLAGVDKPTEAVSALSSASPSPSSSSSSSASASAPAEGDGGAAAQPSLYWIDYLGTMSRVNHGCHGYAAYFTGGLLDKDWRPGMSEDEVLGLAGKCIAEIRMRFMLNQPSFSCYKVDASGISPVAIDGHIPSLPDVRGVPVVSSPGALPTEVESEESA